MSTIQQNLSLYHQLETALRKAAVEKRPMTVRDIYEVPDVKAVARNELQVRDKIKTLMDNNFLTKVTVAESQGGDKRGKIGYYWKDEEKTIEKDFKTPRANVHRVEEEAQVRDIERQAQSKDIELVFNDVTIIIGKNPETGRIRIVIE